MIKTNYHRHNCHLLIKLSFIELNGSYVKLTTCLLSECQCAICTYECGVTLINLVAVSVICYAQSVNHSQCDCQCQCGAYLSVSTVKTQVSLPHAISPRVIHVVGESSLM